MDFFNVLLCDVNTVACDIHTMRRKLVDLLNCYVNNNNMKRLLEDNVSVVKKTNISFMFKNETTLNNDFTGPLGLYQDDNQLTAPKCLVFS